MGRKSFMRKEFSMENPLVSVIIPVYNAQLYLEECLESIRNQSFVDFEVICVDDGSTDDSVKIINKYIESDNRFKVVMQKNQFAGVARNTGMKIARGKYLSFLDADDFFESTMMDKIVKKAEFDNADIVVFDGYQYDNQTKVYIKNSSFIYMDLFEGGVKSSKDIAENLFGFTNPAPWNKLFKKSFVDKNKILFQKIERANDLYFVYMALASAERISVLNEKLLCYRTNNYNSLQGKNYKTPIDFFKALMKVKNELIRKKIYNIFKESFINVSVNHCIYNLYSLNKGVYFEELYIRLKKDIFRKLDILDKDKSFYKNPNYYDIVTRIVNMSAIDYLFNDMYFLHHNAKKSYIFPYEKLKKGKKIVLYGAGTLGNTYYNQFEKMDCEVVLWVDSNEKKYNEYMKISKIDEIKECKYDYIIIAIKDYDVANQIKMNLKSIGVSGDKIVWEAPNLYIKTRGIYDNVR